MTYSAPAHKIWRGQRHALHENVTQNICSRLHPCLVVLPVEYPRLGPTSSSRISSVVSRRLTRECGGGRMSSTGRRIEGDIVQNFAYARRQIPTPSTVLCRGGGGRGGGCTQSKLKTYVLLHAVPVSPRMLFSIKGRNSREISLLGRQSCGCARRSGR